MSAQVRDGSSLPAVVVMVALVAAFVGLFAVAGCPDEIKPPSPFGVSAYSGTETLIRRGEDRKLMLFARVQADYRLPLFDLYGRVDGSAIGDGAAAPDLTNPATFSTLEVYGGARRRIFGQVSLTVLYGYTVALDAGRLQIEERAPQTYGAGVILGDQRAGRWLKVLIGKHEAAGPGTKGLFALQRPLGGRLTAVADGAASLEPGKILDLDRIDFLRFGVAVAVLR